MFTPTYGEARKHPFAALLSMAAVQDRLGILMIDQTREASPFTDADIGSEIL